MCIKATLLEIRLLTVLHLNDDVLIVSSFAVYVINQRAVAVVHCRLLFVKKRDISNLTLSFQEIVEKVEKKWLRELLSENPFKAHIGERINKSAHYIAFLFAETGFT